MLDQHSMRKTHEKQLKQFLPFAPFVPVIFDQCLAFHATPCRRAISGECAEKFALGAGGDLRKAAHGAGAATGSGRPAPTG